MPRPFWSGQIQISLVSFGVNLFPAVESKSEIHFHQISRKTGERVHHQKVSGDDGSDLDPVEKDDIVKGYEYRKGEYITIEPSEIERLRIPSRHTFVVTQFVDLDSLDRKLFEKPYFVVPDGDNQTDAFTVIRKALQSTKKAALGKIAFGGREHLMAISASSEPESEGAEDRGMMAYTLRYAAELRDPAEYFSKIQRTAIDADQLALAKELIQRKTSKFAPEKFHDEYEAALKELVEAKINNVPLPEEKPASRSSKIINLMDALRKSVRSVASDLDGAPQSKSANKKRIPASKKLVHLVKKSTKSNRNRKSA